MKLLLLLLISFSFIATKSQSVQRTTLDSLLFLSKTKKEKRLLYKSFDNSIKEKIIGKWSCHNIIMEYKSNGSLIYFYGDTLKRMFTWHIKEGKLITEENQPLGDSGFYYIYRKTFIIISMSQTRLEYVFLKPEDSIIATKVVN